MVRLCLHILISFSFFLTFFPSLRQFAIIMPVVWIPAIACMYWLERKAMRENLIDVNIARTGVDDAAIADSEKAELAHYEEQTFWQKTVQVYQEVDTIGLILLGFGWSLVRFYSFSPSSLPILTPLPLRTSLTDTRSPPPPTSHSSPSSFFSRFLPFLHRHQLLLPFSLYGGADHGFQNHSLIAMLAVGSACLVAYPFYEWKFAKFPSMPRRVLLNRTFLTSVVCLSLHLALCSNALTLPHIFAAHQRPSSSFFLTLFLRDDR
jgi:hypothetical protein